MENINRGVDDDFYRYKMPKLLAKVEGNGNGIKTVIPNMKDIAKCLSRPPECEFSLCRSLSHSFSLFPLFSPFPFPAVPTKFFGFELGSQTMEDKNGRHIVNGSHDAKKLAELLDVFIKKFVLCSGCGNPETDIVLKKSKKGKEMDVYLSCKACGRVALADNAHKLASYISKNPPPGALSSPSKKDGKKAGKKKGSSDEEDGPGEEISGDLEEITTGVVDLSAKDDKESTGATSQPKEDPAESLAKFVSSGDKTADEIAFEASKLDISNDLAAAVMVQVLLETNLVPQFKKHKDLFKSFTKSEKEQKGILGGLERLVSVTQPDLLPKTSQIIKLFYDSDILEEEVITAWYEKPTKKFTSDKNLAIKVRENAKTLIDWFKEAEEESEEE